MQNIRNPQNNYGVPAQCLRLASAVLLALGLIALLLLLPVMVPTVNLPAAAPLGVYPAYAVGQGITVTKTGPLTVARGDLITYTFTVTNGDGNLEFADGIYVYDTLPAGTYYVSEQHPVGWVPSVVGTPFYWGLSGTFTDYTTAIFTLTLGLNPSVPDGFDVVNDAYGACVGDPCTYPGSPTITTTVNAPVWQIGKTVSSDTTQPGGLLTYTITITNNGTIPTSGTYTIIDDYPDYTSFVSASPTETGNDANSVRWEFSDQVGVGQSRSVTFTVQVDGTLPDANTAIVNKTYQVSGGNAAAVAGSWITSTAQATASLQINKIAAPDPVTAGKLVTYTIFVTNTGSSTGPATGVVISDNLPAELTYQPGSAVFLDGVQGTIDDGGNPLVWTLTDTIAINDFVRVRFIALAADTVPASGLITNTYEASADNASVAFDSKPVGIIPDVPDDVIIDPVPASMQLCETIPVTATLVDQYDNPVSGKTILWGLLQGSGIFNPNSGVTNDDGEVTSLLQATGATNQLWFWARWPGDPNNVNGFSSFISVNTPSLPTQLTLNAASPLVAGGNSENVTATLRDCQNNAKSGETVNLTLNNITLATFPNPTPGSATGTTDSNGQIMTTLTSTSTATANGTVTITGTASGTTGGADWSVQNTINVHIVGQDMPALVITKIANPASGTTVQPGQTITYSLLITNAGPGAATNVVITDDLTANPGFVTGQIFPTGSGPYHNNGVVTFSVPSLASGLTVTARIQVTATATISGTVITNSAIAQDQTGLIGPSNMVSHQVITSTTTEGRVYLPIVLKNQ